MAGRLCQNNKCLYSIDSEHTQIRKQLHGPLHVLTPCNQIVEGMVSYMTFSYHYVLYFAMWLTEC